MALATPRRRDGARRLPEHYPDHADAREHVDRVRADLARLTGEEYVDTDVEAHVPEFRLVDHGPYHEWTLVDEGELLAEPPATYPTAAAAAEAMARVQRLAVGALPVYFAGTTEEAGRDPFPVGTPAALAKAARSLLSRGPRHRRYLDSAETRIVVMGIRGKSSTTRRVGDVFDRRGYDTLVKITGNRPHLIHNGDPVPIDRRGPRVTLYENIKTFWRFLPVLDEYSPDDVVVFENQGITEYTTRLVNERFVRPHVVLLTNIRQDHQDTLGKTRADIARSFARAVPPDTHVISGEQHPVLSDYLRREIEHAGATFQQVSVPEADRGRIGAETVHAVDELLTYLGEPSLPADELDAALAAIQPRWTRLPRGRVYNAAEVNDVESTEAARRALAGEDTVSPFLYLRADRRARTASFATYLDTLYERDLVENVHVAGDDTRTFARETAVPVVRHGPDEAAADVLDAVLDEGYPVVLMGNTVADFMRDLEAEIAARAARAEYELSAE
ncbi:hypothetical protein [Halosegnis marinus]|uniref:hypothetical protein n=1 Tax=Halosegnis marinus TaxID=3034023 RepID=UPI00361D4787